jgi:hypothetical protein
MRTVPGAIISLEKWAGDIEPISNMQEAWFRIKGIPMKFRNKSTVFYAATLQVLLVSLLPLIRIISGTLHM